MSHQACDPLLRESIRHPWVDEAADLPGSKRQQVFHVVDSQMFYNVPDHYADIVHPLISQPIIELCLKIPSYVLTYGGIDRALVRDAFVDMVPGSILARTSKGATTGYILNLLVRNIDVLRQFLLDGLLVGEGVLDNHETDKALSEPSLISDSTLLFPVLNAFRAELWARSWACGERRVPS
jgi:asparagine synthase (glutamine-hydrolysing)